MSGNIPVSVIDAGQRERERYTVGAWNTGEWAVYAGKPPAVYRSVTQAECQAFIDGQALKAQLRELAEQRLDDAVHEMAHTRLDDGDMAAQLKAALLALAEGGQLAKAPIS